MTDEARTELFNSAVREYGERLYWHVRSLVVSHEDADDLMQDIYLKAWNSLPSFKGDSGLFTWLWRIATNESLNFLRWKKVRYALQFQDLSDVLAHKVEAASDFDGDAAEAALQKAIAALPAKQKAVFCMRYYEELPFSQIAEITGTSEGALKASYHQAKKKIEESLNLTSF